MRRGRLEQHASPVDVFHAPSNRFVAGFMGDAAFLPITANGEGPTTELGPVDVPGGGARPTTVAMARPDDLTFEVAGDGSAEVVGAEFRGATWCYTLRLDSGALVQSSRSHLVQAERGTQGADLARRRPPPGRRRERRAGAGLMPTARSADVLVVGGGPAGLGAALASARRGRSVVLVEAAPVLGGMAASIVVGGQRVDLGSHRLHPSAPPAVRALLDELLGDDLQVRTRNGRLRLAGRWVRFPLQAGDLLRSVPPGVGARIARDLVTRRRRRATDGSYAELCGPASAPRRWPGSRPNGGQAVGRRTPRVLGRAGPAAHRRQRRERAGAAHRANLAIGRADVPLSPPRLRRGRRLPRRGRRERRRRPPHGRDGDGASARSSRHDGARRGRHAGGRAGAVDGPTRSFGRRGGAGRAGSDGASPGRRARLPRGRRGALRRRRRSLRP